MPTPVTRRDFFKHLGAASLAGLAPGLPARADSILAAPPRARNCIFMVADGMSLGTLSMADQLCRLLHGRPSHWLQAYSLPGIRRALMDTASLNSLVTDSAAASSAWGSGHKVPNGHINTDPDGTTREPLLPLARRHGLRTGLVTTASITHATPAGFAANGNDRNDQPLFALQYLERGIDLLLGGGSDFFTPHTREDGRDLLTEARNAGYTLLSPASDLSHTPPGTQKLLGLFAPNHLPFEIDRLHTPSLAATVPSLAEMTATALNRLSQDRTGFLVQIEGARVDHAAHANDPAALLHEQLAFDDALAVALTFCADHPDTLLIFTTDHGNANPGLTRGAVPGHETLGRIPRFTGSLSRLTAAWAREGIPDNATLSRTFQETTGGLTLTPTHLNALQQALRREIQSPNPPMNLLTGVTGQILADLTGIGWVGNTHTSDHVELAALGPGSETLPPFLQNTALFPLVTRALGLPHLSNQ